MREKPASALVPSPLEIQMRDKNMGTCMIAVPQAWYVAKKINFHSGNVNKTTLYTERYCLSVRFRIGASLPINVNL